MRRAVPYHVIDLTSTRVASEARRGGGRAADLQSGAGGVPDLELTLLHRRATPRGDRCRRDALWDLPLDLALVAALLLLLLL